MRTFDRRGALIAGASGLAALSLNAQPLAAAVNSRRPNIIFIMADDLGYGDLSCTGSRHIRTPHIDSLAKNGMLFTDGYSNSCVCSPTRIALLTGCYQNRFRIGLEEPLASRSPRGLSVPRDRRTIASALKASGYRTTLIGKWHAGDVPQHGPLQYGYDRFFGIAPGGADYFRHTGVQGGKEIGKGLWENDEQVDRTGYLTDIFGDEAVRAIRAPGTAPFFLSLHFTAPHWPWEAREDEAVSLSLSDLVHQDGGSLATYAKMVQAMDDNVGKVLSALASSGKRKNTIVIFTSDNGGERFSDNWPFVGAKGELLEGGIRVPVLVQWPAKIQAAKTSEQIMASMDFLPTILGLTGQAAPNGEFDGLDLSAHWLGTAPAVKRSLFWRYKAPAQAAVRSGDWKYLRKEAREYLFNLREDQRERADKRKLHPDKFAELKGLWEDWNARMLPDADDSYSHDTRGIYSDRY